MIKFMYVSGKWVKKVFLVSVALWIGLMLLFRQDTISTSDSVSDDSCFQRRLKGPLNTDNPEVIDYLRRRILVPSSRFPYNLSTDPLYREQSKKFGNFLSKNIRKLFRKTRKGFFVEAGALDGEFLSNTLWLEKEMNWTGLLVEPNDKNFEDLERKHRKCWIMKGCLTPEKYPHEIILASTSSLRPMNKAMSMLSRGGSHRLGVTPGMEVYKKLDQNIDKSYSRVQCFPLSSILISLNVTTVDFLSLDMQGLELQVFQSLPLQKIHVRSVVIEDTDTSEFDWKLVKIFNDLGYSLAAAGGSPDYIFIHRNETDWISTFGEMLQTRIDNDAKHNSEIKVE